MEILALIPARGGSRSVPRKNIKKLAGQPLLAYTAESASKSCKISRTILSTEDEEIAAIGRSLGLEVPFLRPIELSGDNTTLVPVVTHVLEKLHQREDYRPEAVILLQPTLPLRTARHIDEALILFEKEKPDTVVSVSPPLEHPAEMVVFEDSGMRFLLEQKTKPGIQIQRQQYPKCYFLNGAIFVFSVDCFELYSSWFGKRVLPYFMRSLESIDIDTPEDFILAEFLLQRRRELGEQRWLSITL